MKNIIKHYILIFISIFFIVSHQLHAQCTKIPTEEAVINGDFETPFNPFTQGPPPWFRLDGFWPTSIMSPLLNNISNTGQSCFYSTLNAYWIGSPSDKFACEGGVHTSFPFLNGRFPILQDHTTNSGKGHFLAVDTWSNDGGPGTRISPVGTQPIVWQQDVKIYPAQMYYFSSWIANWTTDSPAQLRFFVQWKDALILVLKLNLGHLHFLSQELARGHSSMKNL